MSWIDSFKSNLLEVLYRDQPRDELGRFASTGGSSVEKAEAPLFSNLTDEEFGALQNYAGADHAVINEYLRDDDASYMDDVDLEEVTDSVRQMDAAMEKHSTFAPQKVYRFAGENTFERITESGSFQDDGFVSTSSELEGLDTFLADQGYSMADDPPILEIMVPPNTPAVDMNKVGAAMFPGEKEILLDRGLQFEVVERVGNRLKLRVSGQDKKPI